MLEDTTTKEKRSLLTSPKPRVALKITGYDWPLYHITSKIYVLQDVNTLKRTDINPNKENLEDCVNFLADFRIADENELDIEKLSSEVR